MTFQVGSEPATPPLRSSCTTPQKTPRPEPNLWIPSGVKLDDIFQADITQISRRDLMSPQCGRLNRQPSSPHRSGGRCGVNVRVNETDVAIYRVGDLVLCTQAACTHMGANLVQGGRILVDDIEDIVIECPLHKFRFDLYSGKSVSQSAIAVDRLAVYPARVNPQGIVEIGFDSLAAVDQVEF